METTSGPIYVLASTEHGIRNGDVATAKQLERRSLPGHVSRYVRCCCCIRRPFQLTREHNSQRSRFVADKSNDEALGACSSSDHQHHCGFGLSRPHRNFRDGRSIWPATESAHTNDSPPPRSSEQNLVILVLEETFQECIGAFNGTC